MKRQLFTAMTGLLIATSGITVSMTPNSVAQQLNDAYVAVAEEATPSVVFIIAEVQSQGFGYGGYDDPYEMFHDEFFNKFFGGRPGGGRQQRRSQPSQMSQGSGFIVSSDGYVLTNYHVVKNAKKIKVLLHSSIKQREMVAELIGGDPQTDVAVLKIENPDKLTFPYLPFANSSDVKVGQIVFAIGSPFQLEATVTQGIISAKGRQDLQITDLEDFIQTDAAINPGNSGGPLINLNGEVVGINTAIVAPNGGYVGIGFAVPSNIAESIKDQIVSDGKITRGFIGISLQPIDAELAEAFELKTNEGVLVAEVVPQSPAEKGGLKQGDVIIAVDGKKVSSPGSLRREVMLTAPGTKVVFTVLRNGKQMKLPVTIGSHADVHGDNAVVSGELGLTVDNLTPDNIARFHLSQGDQGVVVTQVDQNSISARAGLRTGYLIMAVNHQKVSNVRDFNEALKKSAPSKRVLLLVRSGDVVRFFTIKLP